MTRLTIEHFEHKAADPAGYPPWGLKEINSYKLLEVVAYDEVESRVRLLKAVALALNLDLPPMTFDHGKVAPEAAVQK